LPKWKCTPERRNVIEIAVRVNLDAIRADGLGRIERKINER
jgi:hypothetical protein